MWKSRQSVTATSDSTSASAAQRCNMNSSNWSPSRRLWHAGSTLTASNWITGPPSSCRRSTVSASTPSNARTDAMRCE
ncbi:polyketide synthase domain protein [Burkholderia pseudomallei]|nr:polyketide synthase domain protein [Burkholderia pseudomallei]